MFVLLGCSVIIVITAIAIVKSKKPIKNVLAEAKYEIVYNVIGSRAMLEDFLMRKKNKTDLPLRSGKIAVITGGTRGIGYEVVKMLLKCDITVIIGCRNIQQGQVLLDKFRNEGITTGSIDVFKLDISVLDSVKEFVVDIKKKYQELNYLINNAGIMFGPYIETRDGYESQFSTNYLGHFLLTHLLLPLLSKGGKPKDNARIINVSSCAHMAGQIKFDDINNRTDYIPAEAYAQSKLAQVLFTHQLDRLVKQSAQNIQVYSVHPGIVNTDLFNGTKLKKFAPWMPCLFFKNPEEGAIPIVHACLSADLEEKGGTYIHNCIIYPTSDSSKSIELQEKLFEFTKKLLNIDVYGCDEANST